MKLEKGKWYIRTKPNTRGDSGYMRESIKLIKKTKTHFIFYDPTLKMEILSMGIKDSGEIIFPRYFWDDGNWIEWRKNEVSEEWINNELQKGN